jgi:hypothetical protein
MNDMMLMTLTSTKTREYSPGGTRVKVCYCATKVSNKKIKNQSDKHGTKKKGLLQQNPVNKSQTDNAGIKDFHNVFQVNMTGKALNQNKHSMTAYPMKH